MNGANETLTIYGVAESEAGLYSDGHATREALRVAALSDCTWPARDEILKKVISELLIDHLLGFAVHARRHLSVDPSPGATVLDVSGRLQKRADVKGFNGTLWRALQHIVHAKSLMVVPVEVGESLFTSSKDLRISHVQVTDEDSTTVYICPFGLAHSFLSRRALQTQSN
jgi:hypothetical protein